MNDAEGLTRSLLVASHRAARSLESQLGDLSLRAGEAVLITVLADQGLTMSGVMEALHIKASTATSLVTRLEREGLVKRSPNPDDKRSLIVSLTPSGRRQLGSIRSAFEALDEAIFRAAGVRAVEGHRRVLAALENLAGG